MSNPRSCMTAKDCSFNNTVKSCIDNICFCTPWFGWAGDACNEETVSVIYQRFATIFLITYISVTLILAVRALILNMLVAISFRHFMQPIYLTLIFTVLSGFCIFFNLALKIPASFNPEHVELVRFSGLLGYEDVFVKNGLLASYLLALSVFFQILASLYLLLSYNAVLIQVGRFRRSADVASSLKWSRRLKVFAILFIITFIMLIPVGQFLIFLMVGVISFPFGFVIIFVSFRFISAMDSLCATDHENVKELVNLVRGVCYSTSIIAFVVSVMLVVTYSLGYDYQSRIKPGDFNYIIVLVHVLSFLHITLLNIISWYINSITEGAFLADYWPILCRVFKLWDLKNTKVLPGESEKKSFASDDNIKSIGRTNVSAYRESVQN